jgi:hypothetical protein
MSIMSSNRDGRSERVMEILHSLQTLSPSPSLSHSLFPPLADSIAFEKATLRYSRILISHLPTDVGLCFDVFFREIMKSALRDPNKALHSFEEFIFGKSSQRLIPTPEGLIRKRERKGEGGRGRERVFD